MENASKALLMAGGVLIAILLLTLFAYLFRQMSDSTSSIYSTLEQSDIAEFNQRFLNFEGRGIRTGTEPLTIQDVATLINLAQDSEEDPKFAAKIKILYNGNDLTQTENYTTWLENNKASTKTYNCTEVHVNTETRLVDSVTIEDHT